jgi:hypothetical protein
VAGESPGAGGYGAGGARIVAQLRAGGEVAFAAAPGSVDLAVLLGAGERHGAAAAWSYGLLGEPVRNYSRPQRFDLPGWGRRRLYRADFSDQHSLTRDLSVPVRTYFGLDSRLATGAQAALTWVPGPSSAPRGLHLPGSDRWLAMARGRHGTSRWASGRVQSHATQCWRPPPPAPPSDSHPASTTCTGY